MYRLKFLSDSKECRNKTVEVNLPSEVTEFVGKEHLYSNLNPSPAKAQLALRIGEPTMLVRRPGAVEWKNYRYNTSGDWWITDVEVFDGRLYAVTSANEIALVDLGRSTGEENVALLETAGSFEDRDLKGKVMTCHLFDVETDDGVYILKLVVKGGTIVDFVQW